MNNHSVLAAAIIVRAKKDWQSESLRRIYEDDLRQFFLSDWFEGLCDVVGQNPDNIRRECAGLTEALAGRI